MLRKCATPKQNIGLHHHFPQFLYMTKKKKKETKTDYTEAVVFQSNKLYNLSYEKDIN